MKLPKTSKEFLDQYWLKEELVKICEEKNLPKNGSKQDLLGYISSFLDNKPVTKKVIESKVKSSIRNITTDMIIDRNYANDENHRHFFISEIGNTFKYNVQFMNWMKENKGKKTYKEAIIEWKNINEEKKKGHKNSIGKQFEYNQYTRDFFEINKGKTREECIKCWNYKKSKSGSHIYEDTDLKILEEKA